MSSPFIPRKDADARDWFLTFARGVAANPGRFFLSLPNGQTLLAAANEFAVAYAVSIDPDRRTTTAVARKDACRAATEKLFRSFAARIKAIDVISDPDKIAIGVRPKRTSHCRRQVPTSSPVLMVIAATPGSHTLRFHDSFSPHSSAKPFGAVCLQLFCDITDGTRQPSVAEARFFGSHTRNPLNVGFESKDTGKLATYWGRWASRRGDTGPWSLPSSFTIATSGVQGGVMSSAPGRVHSAAA